MFDSNTICFERGFVKYRRCCHFGSCVNTVGDTILMQVEPRFSHEVGKDFLKRENGGGLYYTIFGEDVVESVS